MKKLVSFIKVKEATSEEIKLLQNIGNDICEGCGPNADCGIAFKDCTRMQSALNTLYTFLYNYKQQIYEDHNIN